MEQWSYKVRFPGEAWLAVLLLLLSATAQAQSPIKIDLVASKTTYLEGEPIKLQITVANTTGADVITQKGFFDERFDLRLTFIDPDGKVIRFLSRAGGAEPGPPLCFEGRCTAVLVEVIPPLPDGQTVIIVGDARANYDLAKFGHYRAFVSVPFDTFPRFGEDPNTGERFGFLDDSGRQFFDPVQSNTISFDITSPTPIASAAIAVSANQFTLGDGSEPTLTKVPLENLPVRLFRLDTVPADFQPVDHKTFALVWQFVPPVATATTNGLGNTAFNGISKGDYVVIGLFTGPDDVRFAGADIAASDHAWGTANVIAKNLVFLGRTDGSHVPAKIIQLQDSELFIIQPEFVLWDSAEEFYPFVFESDANWSITTVLRPPKRFVALPGALRANVSSGPEAIQFSVRDAGGRFEDTTVIYSVLRNGKNKPKHQIIKEKIGVQLSPELAEQKGLSVFGHTDSPDRFMGGKKMKKEEKAKAKRFHEPKRSHKLIQ